MNGIVMGGGAGLSMPTTFRVVTEKAVSFCHHHFPKLDFLAFLVAFLNL